MKEQAGRNDRQLGRTIRPRQRLAPDERIPQILDAALVEFTQHGFVATRMDDIAQRCGLSKGGLYAHFDSKDAIFKALLERALLRTDWERLPRLGDGIDTQGIAEWIVDRLHATLLTAEVVGILRLLIPEGERVPHSLQTWQQNLVRLRSSYVTQLLQDRLATLAGPGSLLGRHPWLALSPVMHVLLWRTLFGNHSAPDPDFRQAHVDLLCALLRQPPADGDLGLGERAAQDEK